MILVFIEHKNCVLNRTSLEAIAAAQNRRDYYYDNGYGYYGGPAYYHRPAPYYYGPRYYGSPYYGGW